MSLLRKSLILLLSIATGALPAKDLPKFQPGPASAFPNKQTVDKLTIAAAPYDTEALAQTAFGKSNPNRYGVLPVLVVMQNDGKGALQLIEMSVRYVTLDGNRMESTPGQDLQYLFGGKRPRQPGGPTSPIPIPRGRSKNPMSGWEIQGRAFAVKMLPAGQAANGFFYFQTVPREGSQLYITGIREAATGKELFYVEIPLKGAR
jgi:hypothetical protein